jgi:hypothetical protein
VSALGQKRTYAVGQKLSRAASIVDQLVGAFEHCRWDGQTDLFGGLIMSSDLVSCSTGISPGFALLAPCWSASGQQAHRTTRDRRFRHVDRPNVDAHCGRAG